MDFWTKMHTIIKHSSRNNPAKLGWPARLLYYSTDCSHAKLIGLIIIFPTVSYVALACRLWRTITAKMKEEPQHTRRHSNRQKTKHSIKLRVLLNCWITTSWILNTNIDSLLYPSKSSPRSMPYSVRSKIQSIVELTERKDHPSFFLSTSPLKLSGIDLIDHHKETRKLRSKRQVS